MQPKNTNLKPGFHFQPLLNPGFGFGEMAGSRAPGFSKPGFQSLLHMSSQYGKMSLTNGWHLLASLGYLSKFQRVSRLGFVTAPTSLNGGQPNFVRCLAVSWAGTILCTLLWAVAA